MANRIQKIKKKPSRNSKPGFEGGRDSDKIACQVAHAVPGRMRLKIPRVRGDLEYRERLQTSLAALAGVTQVRLAAEAQSVVVIYDPKVLPPETVEECLAPLVQRAAHRKSPEPRSGVNDRPDHKIAIKFDRDLSFYAPTTLKAYEQKQAIEISLWLSERPKEIEQDIGKIWDTVASATQALIPDGVFKKVQQSFVTATEHWKSDWQHIKPAAGVEDCHQLQHAELKFCDQLADGVSKHAATIGAVEGGLSDAAGLLGAGFDLPLSVLMALQTVRRIGLCYGYSPVTKYEKQMIWVILALGTATTSADKQKAVEAWRESQVLLYPQILKDLVQASVQADAFDVMLETLVRAVIGHIAEKESGGSLPVLGVALGAYGGLSLIKGVCRAARRVYQFRWLTDNGKLIPGSTMKL